jgi:hypothetical protein
MIVVQVGVKTECKIYGCRSILKNNEYLNTHRSHTGVKLVAEQLNIFRFNRCFDYNNL